MNVTILSSASARKLQIGRMIVKKPVKKTLTKPMVSMSNSKNRIKK